MLLYEGRRDGIRVLCKGPLIRMFLNARVGGDLGGDGRTSRYLVIICTLRREQEKKQKTSDKRQAIFDRRQAIFDRRQATSDTRQATQDTRQRHKTQDTRQTTEDRRQKTKDIRAGRQKTQDKKQRTKDTRHTSGEMSGTRNSIIFADILLVELSSMIE